MTKVWILLGALMFLAETGCQSHGLRAGWRWERLPSVPDQEGFAGAFAGVSDGALVVAGGANITGDKWGDSFQKVWHDSIFVLEQPGAKWQADFKLPHALGYGVSVTTKEGIICIGGSDAKRHYAEVFRLRLNAGRLGIASLPSLPKPCANACGALVGNTIYIAGGIESPAATSAMKNFWALDLSAANPHWTELEPWPGPARMLSVAGARNGSFYLFSGAKLEPDASGKPVREYLRDAYRYTPGRGWTRLADLPRAAVAAASPADFGGGLFVISGDDGTQVNFQPLSRHPGFPRDVLSYDEQRDAWTVAGEVPFSRATTTTVEWRGHLVVPMGEVRPRERTPEVWWVGEMTND